jgi:C4-dicarboxylate-binding protein DctP
VDTTVEIGRHKTIRKTIEDSGVQIYTLTEEERQAFVEASQPVYEEYRDVIGAELLDKVLALTK